jgi:hypothetical protein
VITGSRWVLQNYPGHISLRISEARGLGYNTCACESSVSTVPITEVPPRQEGFIRLRAEQIAYRVALGDYAR